MTAEHSVVAPLAAPQARATVVEPAPKPADRPAPSATTSHAVPPTGGHLPPAEDEVRALRQSRIDQLRDLQGQVLTSPADPALVATYAPKFLQHAAAVYAARSARDLVLMGLQIDQLQCAWEQYRRVMERRDRARLHAVVLLVALFAFLVVITVFDDYFGLDVTNEIRLLHVPVYVIVWSMIGSVCSLLYRFNRSADAEMDDPMRVLFTRPLMGVTLGSFSYLLVQLGFLTMSTPGSGPGDTAATLAQLPPNVRVVHLMIVVAFIVGFSDRLSEGLLKSLVGKFGGDRTGELVSLERMSPTVNPSALTAILNAGEAGPTGYVLASTASQGASAMQSSNGVDGPSGLPPSPEPAPAAVPVPGTTTPNGPLSRLPQPLTPPASGSTATGP